MSRWRKLPHRVLAILWCCCLLFGAVYAQETLPFVPREFYEGQRRMDPTGITFCVWSDSPTIEFEKALGAELAAALLLEPRFYEVASTAGLPDTIFWESVFLGLADHCEAFMGFILVAERLPEWLISSRPYYQARVVLAVTNPEVRTLADVPRDHPVGSQLLTTADYRFLTYLQTLRADQRWRRLPYNSTARMVQNLLDGTIGAALILEPLLYTATDGDPAGEGIHVASPEPLNLPPTRFTIVFRAQDVVLRTMIDEAIVALIEDGTIADLLQEHNLPGQPGSLGR